MSKNKNKPQTIDATDEVIVQAREILTERHDREPTFDELRFLAECIQQEIDDEDHADELEREAQMEAQAEHDAKMEAFERLTRGLVPLAEFIGWDVAFLTCSHTFSHYYKLFGENEKMLTIRVSTHEAKNGAGFNRETGLPHDECDVNLIAGRDTLADLEKILVSV